MRAAFMFTNHVLYLSLSAFILRASRHWIFLRTFFPKKITSARGFSFSPQFLLPMHLSRGTRIVKIVCYSLLAQVNSEESVWRRHMWSSGSVGVSAFQDFSGMTEQPTRMHFNDITATSYLLLVTVSPSLLLEDRWSSKIYF